MEAEPIAQAMGGAANGHLRGGVLPSHTSHERRTSLVYRFARKKSCGAGSAMRRSRLFLHGSEIYQMYPNEPQSSSV
jgi:hypothetical protein